MKVERTSDKDAWDAYVAGHEHATVYHRWAWREAVVEAYGLPAYYLMVRDGNRVVGVLPLIHQKSLLFGNALVSLPFAAFGGPLTDNNKAFAALMKEARLLQQKLGASYVECKNRSLLGGFDAVKERVFSVRELAASSDNLLSSFEKNKRKTIRKSGRQDLQAAWGNDGLRDFYRILERNMHRLGSPVHSLRFFSSLLKRYGDDAKLLVVSKNGNPVYGSFLFLDGTVMRNVWSSSLFHARKWFVNDFGVWTSMQEAMRKDCSAYDLGTSQDDSSNLEFKRRWGAAQETIYHQYLLANGKSMPDRSERSAKRRLFAAVWKVLPLLIIRPLNPKMRRYL